MGIWCGIWYFRVVYYELLVVYWWYWLCSGGGSGGGSIYGGCVDVNGHCMAVLDGIAL